MRETAAISFTAVGCLCFRFHNSVFDRSHKVFIDLTSVSPSRPSHKNICPQNFRQKELSYQQLFLIKYTYNNSEVQRRPYDESYDLCSKMSSFRPPMLKRVWSEDARSVEKSCSPCAASVMLLDFFSRRLHCKRIIYNYSINSFL